MTMKNTADNRHDRHDRHDRDDRDDRDDRVGRRIAVEEAIRRAKDHSGLWNVDRETQKQDTASGTKRKGNAA